MGWDTEFRSPIEIEGTDIVLRTLQDAKNALLPANADDPDIELPSLLQKVRRGLNLAATRNRPKDLSDATRATLRAFKMAGFQPIMNTDHIRRKPVERPMMATPKLRDPFARASDPSNVPDIQETLRKALARAKALK